MEPVIKTIHQHSYPDRFQKHISYYAVLKVRMMPDSGRVGAFIIENPGPADLLVVAHGHLGGRRTEVVVPARTPSITVELPAAKRFPLSWEPGAPTWAVSMGEV